MDARAAAVTPARASTGLSADVAAALKDASLAALVTFGLSIPIIALTVRDHEKVPNESDAGPRPDTLRDRFTKREAEGVFIVREGLATFRPVKVGVAGDDYFEVLDGIREGETIVAGTYQAIRDLKDGAKVRQADTTKTRDAPSS